eukprot:TRINITY_DN20304_c0_g1_i2.p1 TRINITY_DN20304_c0_g1~~TRINITY_DN20304_c0_g1_i2.p1  ORF type:complete len:420 (-),score=31.99 TRINITY_DN20304_c0_g1_i2:86-1345(-)
MDYSKWDNISDSSDIEPIVSEPDSVDALGCIIEQTMANYQRALASKDWSSVQKEFQEWQDILQKIVYDGAVAKYCYHGATTILTLEQIHRILTTLFEAFCCNASSVNHLCESLRASDDTAFEFAWFLGVPYSERYEWVTQRFLKRKEMWVALVVYTLELEKRSEQQGIDIVEPWQLLHSLTWMLKAKHIEAMYVETGLHDACKHTISSHVRRRSELSTWGKHPKKEINFIVPMALIASAYLCDGVYSCKQLVADDKALIVSVLCLLDVMWQNGCLIRGNKSLQQVCSMLYEEGKAGRIDKNMLMANRLFKDFCSTSSDVANSSFPKKNPTRDCLRGANFVSTPDGILDLSNLRCCKTDANGFQAHLHRRSLEKPRCFHCGVHAQQSHQFKFCSRCRVAAYCSQTCQKKDWRNHKLVCKP